MRKKLISTILCICMILSLVGADCMSAWAQDSDGNAGQTVEAEPEVGTTDNSSKMESVPETEGNSNSMKETNGSELDESVPGEAVQNGTPTSTPSTGTAVDKTVEGKDDQQKINDENQQGISDKAQQETEDNNQTPVANITEDDTPIDDSPLDSDTTHTCKSTFDKRISMWGGTLESGNYYLYNDIKLKNNLVIPEGATVNICMNGHTLTGTGTGSVITVGEKGKGDCSLIISDCKKTGCITGGNAVRTSEAEDYLYGGAILAYGDLTISDVKISNNTADIGGGIAAFKKLEAWRCVFDSNLCVSTAANIYNGSSKKVRIAYSQILNGNRAAANGITCAGIYCVENSNLDIETCTISGGTTMLGGAALVLEDNSALYMNLCNITDNTSLFGSAVTTGNNCSITLRNTSIVNNTAAMIVGDESVFTLQGKVEISNNVGTGLLGNSVVADLQYSNSNPIQFVTTGDDALSTDSKVYITGTNNLINGVLTCDYPEDVSYADVFISNASGYDIAEVSSDTEGYKHLHYGNTISVTYNNNGHGGDNRVESSVSGIKLVRPGNPLENGYKFEGWYTDGACTQAFDFENTVVTSDITLYAKWSELPMEEFSVEVSSSFFDFTRNEVFKWNTMDFAYDDPQVYSTRMAQVALLTMLDVHSVGLVKLIGTDGNESVNDKFLAALGFSKFEESRVEASDGIDTDDTTNLAIAMANADDGSVIISVSVLGTSLSGDNAAAEWRSNFDVGADTAEYYNGTGEHPDWTDKDNHKGFEVAATRALNVIRDYVSRNVGEDVSKIHFVFSGYSRGAAIANILGAKAEDGELGVGKAYSSRAYTYASPNTTSAANARSYKTIHNLVNVDDIMPHIPMASLGMTRYGEDIEWGIKGTGLESTFLAESGGVYQSDDYTARKLADVLSLIAPVRNKLYTIDTSDNGKVEYFVQTATTEAEARKEVSDFFESIGASTYYKIDSVTKRSGQYVVTYHIAFAATMNVMSTLFDSMTGSTTGTDMEGLSKQFAYFMTPGFMTNGSSLIQLLTGAESDIPNAHFPLAYFYALYGAVPVEHECNGVTYSTRLRPVGGQLESGNYYLESDIKLQSSYYIPEGAEVNICLNGKSLSPYSSMAAFPAFVIAKGGKLTISDCEGGSGGIKGFTTSYGACFVNQGTLTINAGTYSGNKAAGNTGKKEAANGGVICNCEGGILTINGGTFKNNSAGNGGVIYNMNSAQITINGCEFTGNKADCGGVLYNASGATATLNGGTYSNNTAGSYGGALYCAANSATTLKNVAIRNNAVSRSDYYTTYGAGIAIFKGAKVVLSGQTVITGNNDGICSGGSNICLCELGAKFTVDSSFSGHAGVMLGFVINSGQYVKITGLNNKDHSSGFTMDTTDEIYDDYYVLKNMNNYLVIECPASGQASTEIQPTADSPATTPDIQDTKASMQNKPTGSTQNGGQGAETTGEGGNDQVTGATGSGQNGTMQSASIFSSPTIWVIIGGIVVIIVAVVIAITLKKKRMSK